MAPWAEALLSASTGTALNNRGSDYRLLHSLMPDLAIKHASGIRDGIIVRAHAFILKVDFSRKTTVGETRT